MDLFIINIYKIIKKLTISFEKLGEIAIKCIVVKKIVELLIVPGGLHGNDVRTIQFLHHLFLVDHLIHLFFL